MSEGPMSKAATMEIPIHGNGDSRRLADDDGLEQDLQQVMVSGPNLNETSIVSGGYGGTTEGIVPTSIIKGPLVPSHPPRGPLISPNPSAASRIASQAPMATGSNLHQPHPNPAMTGEEMAAAAATRGVAVEKLDIVRKWGINTYKCTKQLLSERFGRGSRTVDLELETQIELLRDTKRKYESLLGLARALTNHFYSLVQTQHALADAFSDLSQKSPELQEEFGYNAETQKLLCKNGETLLGAVNFFVSSINTLVNKTMEDTLMTVKQYETARLEYDAYRTDLEELNLGPRDASTLCRLDAAQANFHAHRAKYEKLRADVAVKLKFLEENKVKVMHKQLLLFHNAISAYFAGNQQQLEQTLKQFNIKLKNNPKPQLFLLFQLALYVLSFLEPRDLLRAAQTCRYWRILAEDNLLWREKCRDGGIEEPLSLRKRRLLSPGFMYSPWKLAFLRQHRIDMNWRNGDARPPKVLKGHDDHVITCLQFCGNRIVSGSDDNTLKVWSAITGECVQTLVGHTGGVWSSQMRDNIIISGSTDRTLKVWNADTGECVHTLYGHTSTVRCMHLHDTRVVSGSRDATLRLWDIETGQCLHVLMGHVAAVRCVQYNGHKVVSGAYDYTVKVWDPETESCTHTLQGHTNRVYSLQFDGTHIVSGSLDTSIRVWDAESGNCLHTLMGHQSLTSGMELRDNILVSGNADSTVKIWDIKTGQCLQTLQGPSKHQSAVTCLQFSSKFVVTSSDDGTVKLWDLKTGEFVRNLVALESGGSGGVVWRIRASNTKLVCAVGSRNGTEETKLLVLDFDVDLK